MTKFESARRRLRLPLQVAGVLLCLSTGEALAEKRIALVIGNSAYKNAVKLANPTNDAGSIAALLKSSGFDVVESKSDLDNSSMRRAVRDFTEAAQDADIAVVYYAGHGIEVNGENYLIPTDAALERDIDVEDETVSLDRLIRAMAPVKTLRLVILDACRDNPFAKTMKRTFASRSVGRGLAEVDPGVSNTLVAFAAKAGSTAFDGNGQHSPFTTALLKNIMLPGLDIRLALGRVRDDVFAETSRKQEPFVYGSLGGGTVSLVPAAPQRVAPATPSVESIVRDYQFARDINTKESWESFMAAHAASGYYYNLAKAARDKATAEEAMRNAVEEAQHKQAELDEKAKAAQVKPSPPTAIALATPNPAADPTKKSDMRAIDLADIAGLLQFHLKRVGCDPGALDGAWNDKTSRAMALFNTNAHTNFDVKVASLNALDSVKQHTTRVCPLICGKGYRVEQDSCVAIACQTRPST